jgi:hypothetical protein
VALKVLPVAATMDARQRQRFHNEARAAASLHHPHIVPVHAVGEECGIHYYAMHLIDGQSLAEVIGRKQRESVGGTLDMSCAPAASPTPTAETTTGRAADMTPAPHGAAEYRRLAEMLAQAAEALEYAHQMGVVHRDIKPANLLVDGQGKLWVTDFGLARFGTASDLTMTGDLVGTLRYMSPEQALARHGLVDHRTDVYGLGATLYELLTGRPAVDGKDREEVLRKIAFDEPAAPRSVERAIPPDLETVVLKALAKEPGERYATAQDLADDLRRFLEHKPVQARRPTLVQRVAKAIRRHQAVVVTAAVVSSVAALGLAASTALVWVARDREADARALAESNYERAEGQRVRAEEAVAGEAAQRRRADSNFRQAIEEITALLEQANDPKVPRDQLARVQAERAIPFLRERLAENRTDPEGRLLTGLAYLGVGQAYLASNEVKAGDAYAEGLAILQQLAADFPDDAGYRQRLAQVRQRTQVAFRAAILRGGIWRTSASTRKRPGLTAPAALSPRGVSPSWTPARTDPYTSAPPWRWGACSGGRASSGRPRRPAPRRGTRRPGWPPTIRSSSGFPIV